MSRKQDYRDKEIQEIFKELKSFKSKVVIQWLQNNYFVSEVTVYRAIGRNLDAVQICHPSSAYRKIVIEKNHEELLRISNEQP